MPSLRYLAGDPAYYNIMARGTLSSTNEDSRFPRANVKDGDPSSIFKFNDAGNSRHITVDANMTTNGNFTTWSGGAPVSWVKTITGTGSVTEDTSVFASSPASARMSTGASGTAKLVGQMTVRAWQKMQLELKIRTDAGGGLVGRIFIQNLRTRKYLHPTDGWTPSTAAYISGGVNGSFQIYGSGIVVGSQPNGQFQVEDFLTVEADTCLLEITLDVTGGTGNVWFDDVDVFPGCDFSSVHGHNVEPGLPVLARSGFDGVAFSTRATMTARRPSFFATFELVYHRHYRLEYSGTPSVASGAIWYGEIVFGQIYTALTNPRFGYELAMKHRQVRTKSRGGVVRVVSESLFEERLLRLAFGLKTTEFNEHRDEIFRRSEGGRYPLVVVPVDTEPMVLHGRIDERWATRRNFNAFFDGDLAIEESAFGSIVA